VHVFVTGGAGYIGSHTILALLREGHDVTCFDNYCNSNAESLSRVENLAGRKLSAIVEGDLRDLDQTINTLKASGADSVIHFAGLKAVGESVEQPSRYHDNNVGGAENLLRAMNAVGVKKLVFSSSATVYGNPHYSPFDETHPTAPTNPYGDNKLMIEKIIGNWCHDDKDASGVILRYFNPVGADPSGEIGEDPRGIPNNLMPFIAQTAVGRRKALSIFGNDYETRDGTGERDYIHVVDLADAHLKALEYADKHDGCELFNIGTGTGVTVLELVTAFENASGRKVPYEIVGRRSGDISTAVANTTKAETMLGWRAKLTLADMCQSCWLWQSKNPDGYSGR